MILLSSDWDNTKYWLQHSGTHIAGIVAAMFVAYLVFRAVFPRIAKTAMLRGAHPPDEETHRRAQTIIGVVDGSARVVFLLLALVTILPEFGVSIAAVVTGLGIGGLALALGSQSIVRDAVNGIFLLAEDQYRTGDVVKVADVTGTVETITLRRTILRDQDGVVHSVPNGAISVVSNLTRDFAQVNVDVRISYGEDIAKVRRVVEEMAKSMAVDSETSSMLLEPPRVSRVDSVDDGAVTVTVSAKARPTARWKLESDLRQRLAEAFLREKVHVPFPVYIAEAGNVATPGDEAAASTINPGG
ncbi:MAG: mechanosensitive ion channel family protein [Chloroflexota bacterium]